MEQEAVLEGVEPEIAGRITGLLLGMGGRTFPDMYGAHKAGRIANVGCQMAPSSGRTPTGEEREVGLMFGQAQSDNRLERSSGRLVVAGGLPHSRDEVQRHNVATALVET